MGVLDDLKKEAEQKEQGNQTDGDDAEAQEAFYQAKLQPVMRRAHDYFADLVKALEKVERKVSASYALDPEQKDVVSLPQGKYVFRTDDFDNPRKLIVATECQLDKRREYLVRGRGAVTRYAALLDDHQLPYYTKDELDHSHQVVNATFTLEGPLKVQIRLLASPENRCIYIDLLNVESLPTKRYKVPPEKLTDDLLDRLARMLMREESVLIEVKVSEDARQQLREKLEAERRRQAVEQAKVDAAIEAERRAEEEAKLLNRAKKSVTGIAGGLKKKFRKD
ncbi:MAG: hypothetical protein AAGI24_16745 [Pseudomonadota bacterium]